MPGPLPKLIQHLAARRKALGMSFASLADRSGVSIPTVKRIFAGQVAQASFANVEAIALALGTSFTLQDIDLDDLRREQARAKAELVTAVAAAPEDEPRLRRIEQTYHALLAGSRRELWR